MIQPLKNRVSTISSNFYEENKPIRFQVLQVLNYFEEKSSLMT